MPTSGWTTAESRELTSVRVPTWLRVSPAVSRRYWPTMGMDPCPKSVSRCAMNSSSSTRMFIDRTLSSAGVAAVTGAHSTGARVTLSGGLGSPARESSGRPAHEPSGYPLPAFPDGTARLLLQRRPLKAAGGVQGPPLEEFQVAGAAP